MADDADAAHGGGQHHKEDSGPLPHPPPVALPLAAGKKRKDSSSKGGERGYVGTMGGDKEVTLGRLGVFLASLAANSLVFDATEQLVNAGIARGAEVKRTLAAMGLAMFIVRWFCAIFASFEPIGLVLVDSIQARRVVMRILGQAVAFIALFMVLLAWSPFGTFIIDTVHRASPELSHSTKLFLLGLIAWPFLDGLHRLHRGILLKHGRHIALVWAASLANAIVQVVIVGLCLGPLRPQDPHILPLTAAYGGIAAEVSVNVNVCVAPEFAQATTVPLCIYSFIGIAVAFRAYCTSWATAIKQTSSLTSSAFVRFGAVVIAGTLLPLFGLHGAVMGIGALLAGFSTEAMTVVWTTRNLRLTLLRRSKAHAPLDAP
ncbi:hypothetical protein PTSG_06863 [Salpingoeca rosetta]|uniref:Uncharacterized protein n=1 Tax=Salpingoeca rosetta (strain ATCC 50818 / BSB-021) TaxID=946362 RepID=F2UF12_SALR5|nr:uncharacterized protein PTSG_06863 [Salpingoeca rosetta]EGD75212.1 hypothetical protein PTSG_06863 [Salpingoeca rosetta]|eukprot:XP_004992265.1 hypothetical protein PTSG_06863 [Salpingoeca rosetta]